MSQAGRLFMGSGGFPVETLTGNTGGPVGPTGGNINVVGSGEITVDGNPITSTLTISLTGEVADTFPTDSGTATPTAGELNIFGGSNINTSGAGNTVTINLDNSILLPETSADALNGVISINSQRFVHAYGDDNAFFGPLAGNLTLTTNTAVRNVGIGFQSLDALTVGANNVGVGYNSLTSILDGSQNVALGSGSAAAATTMVRSVHIGYNSGLSSNGNDNTIVGWNSLQQNTTGVQNTSLGSGTLSDLDTGSNNIAVGFAAGSQYLTSESSNICIGHVGVSTESNTLRLGTNGGGAGQQNRCFVAGIDGVNVGSVATVVTEASNQLGTAVITGGTGITVTPGANTITISSSGTTLFDYTNVNTTPYVVLDTDTFLGVDCSGGAITIQLPNAPAPGRVWYIKDRTGSANTFNITVTTVGGAVNIDGSTTYVMNTQYASIGVLFDGSTYQIF